MEKNNTVEMEDRTQQEAAEVLDAAPKSAAQEELPPMEEQELAVANGQESVLPEDMPQASQTLAMDAKDDVVPAASKDETIADVSVAEDEVTATQDADSTAVEAQDAEADVLPQKKMSRRKRRKNAKRMRIVHLSLDKDIRYRGILSYRSLRIIAWVCLLLSQVGLLLSLGAKVDAGFALKVGHWGTVLKLASNFMTPLFLMAVFAIILNNSRKFSSLLCLYGGFSIVFYLLFLLLHDRYLIGIVMRIGEMTREEAIALVDMLIPMLTKSGYFCYNIFVDLFLCTLLTFFMVYQPKKVFVGKKVIFFRLLAILPILYELASIVVKALTSIGTIVMPTYVYPLLTTKPPMTFLLFVALILFIKRRERLYLRYDKTHEDYQAFLKSNLNSLQFSSFLSLQILAVAFLDVVMLFVFSGVIVGKFSYMEEPFSAAMDAVMAWGFGDCILLVLAIPFIMLFSYTRSYKDTKLDLIINMLGVVGLVLVYLEGLYQFIIRGYSLVQNLLPL